MKSIPTGEEHYEELVEKGAQNYVALLALLGVCDCEHSTVPADWPRINIHNALFHVAISEMKLHNTVLNQVYQ